MLLDVVVAPLSLSLSLGRLVDSRVVRLLSSLQKEFPPKPDQNTYSSLSVNMEMSCELDLDVFDLSHQFVKLVKESAISTRKRVSLGWIRGSLFFATQVQFAGRGTSFVR